MQQTLFLSGVAKIVVDKQKKLLDLKNKLSALYQREQDSLPFHGWHHIEFVTQKALEFAISINADLFIVESAAFTHDLNYIVQAYSKPEIARELRRKILSQSGYTESEIEFIEQVIIQAHTEYRSSELSKEAKSLSDADTLFKALPITPIIFAHKYLKENSIDIRELAQKVVDDQIPLMEKGIYFYTELAKVKYLKWAQTNLDLWSNVLDALEEEEIQKLLDIAKA